MCVCMCVCVYIYIYCYCTCSTPGSQLLELMNDDGVAVLSLR